MRLFSKFAGIALLSLVIIGIPAPELMAQGAGRRQVAEGNKYFSEGKFDEANNKYRDAEVANPESPIVHFNIGDALYKKRKYEDALQAYHKAIQKSDDVQLQSQTYYNLGNTLYRLNKWPESILAYQQALKLNPSDEDAKYNLEYVRAKLKENAQKQPQNQQQQQQQQQQSASDQQNQQDQQKQDQQQQQEQQQNEKQQEQQAAQQKKDKEQLSKEDAERLLEALRNQEKETQKERQMRATGRVRVEKDW
ncbi:MAG: tetratricopeptide repeat protein [candidate division KSB1 bacterium]|nr:tetratricopeptide repeat protein [candidate division KSB1 bacterium]MDZ7304833.1 tetratricopeptide repeat protein [candidate division KSB1 bacterium]MDZ7313913.1 tetratricopeptide repeat protein [candidate division KSB1 bacterium]